MSLFSKKNKTTEEPLSSRCCNAPGVTFRFDIDLWVKHGIMLPAQKHIAKPEVTMPRAPTAPMEPVPMEEVKRVIKKEEDIEKRIEELRKKNELSITHT